MRDKRTPKEVCGEASLWLQSCYVLSSLGVVLMSCKVNFHEYDQHCSILLEEFNMSTYYFCL